MRLAKEQIRQILTAIAINENVVSFDASETLGFKKGITELLSILKYEPSDIVDNLYKKHLVYLSKYLFTKKTTKERRVEMIKKYFEKLDVS